jgi:hypothetical protein
MSKDEYTLEKTMLFDQIAQVALQFETAKNPSHVKRRLESMLVEWVDSMLARGMTSDRPLIGGITGTGHIASMDDLIESSEEWLGERQDDVFNELKKNLAQRVAVNAEGYKGDYSAQMTRLLEENDRLIRQCKGLGISLVDRSIKFEADIREAISLKSQLEAVEHPLAPYADLDLKTSTLYVPQKHLKEALALLKEEKFVVKEISACELAIPGLKNADDLEQSIAVKADLDVRMKGDNSGPSI